MGLVQKSFSDIITFSRSSNATRVGPTGLVEYAPHNLLTYSQQFDNAAWTKTSCTATANSSTAPDGTVTADNITTSAAASSVSNSVAITANTQTYTQSLYVKFVSGSANFRLRAALVGGTAQAVYLTINAQTGVFVASDGTYTITSVGNGWYRISITIANNGTNTTFAWQVYPTDDASTTNEMALWGAQLSVGPYALDYTPTTSAAVYGPRFDYDGSGVTIVEPVSTNLLTYSEDFTNAAWVKTVAGDTVTANAGVAPDGTTTADKLVADTTSSGGHRIYQSVSTSGVHTLSVYAKAAGYSSLVVTSSANNWVYFNLAAGTVSSSLGTGWSAATITDAGNGWYRCTATTSNSNTAYFIGAFNGVGTNGNSVPTFAGNGTDGILIWGAQLEVGSTATGYMVSGATNGFRAVPVVSGSATPKGLLVEEQRTNLLTYSEQFDNAAWTKVNTTATANAVTAPDGQVTADLVTDNSVTATHSVALFGVTVSASANTLSVYAKNNTRRYLSLRVNDNATNANAAAAVFDLQSGVISQAAASYGTFSGASATISVVGTGWYRLTLTFTSSVTSVGVKFELNDGSALTADGQSSYSGNGSSLYIWGAQLEAGSFATSYIPTLASTVTRSADVASVNTLSPWYNQTEGTIYTESVSQANNRIAWFRDPAGGNYGDFIASYLDATFNGGGSIHVSSAQQVSLSTQNAVNSSTVAKIGFAYKQNDFALCMNNGTVATDTNGNVPSVNVLNIGWHTDSVYLNGHIRRLAYYPRRLTNAEIQALTS